MADPNADYWTVQDIAEYWNVAPQTVRTYRSRKRGELPEPDNVFGRSPVWKPATIINFQRPGQGARTDLRETPVRPDEKPTT
ncbi:helix-turn-helix transcriptional regulator [Streptomyces sp. NPDC004721]